MARRISVEIIGDSRSLEHSFKRAEISGRGFTRMLIRSTLVVDAVQKAIEGLGATVRLAREEFVDHARVTAQTNAAIKSTGDISNVTGKAIEGLALQLSNLSGIDDEVIQAGENILLSFTNIRNFAGKGNDIFTQATKAAVDFSTRTGRSLTAGNVAIGRALSDPAKAASSLRRAFIVLTADEKKAIDAALKHKGVLAAQKLILDDLVKRYGGAAKAAGQTLPGQLNVLKDRFKDLAGSGIGLIAPALAKGVSAATDFVRKFSEISGGRAKLSFLGSSLKNLGTDIFNSIDWGRIRQVGQRIAQRVGERIASVDWRAAISRAGRAVGHALVTAMDKLSEWIRSVNWNRVGAAIATGLGKAIGAVVLFLASVDWSRVAHSLARLLGNALLAVAGILLGIGKVLGRAVLRGIGAGFESLKAWVVQKADVIVLKIIEPFSHLPKGAGAWARRMKDELHAQLAAMQIDAINTGQVINAALSGRAARPASFAGALGKASSTALSILGQAKDVVAANTLPSVPTGFDTGVGGGGGGGQSAADKANQWFDDRISRMLDRLQYIPRLKDQLAKLKQIAALIAARLAITKDITRRLTLEDKLLSVRAQLKDVAQQVTDAAQFRLLGLGPTGEDITPGVKNLKKRVASLAAAIQGSFLDTGKTRSVLQHIRQVLAAGIGNVSKDVRAKIKEMLDAIDQQLKDHAGNMTKFRHVSTAALLAGLGLDPATAKILRQRLAQMGPGGTIPQHSAAFSLAGGGGMTVVMHNPQFHGVNDVRTLKQALQKEDGRRSGARRGPYAGRH